MAAAALEQGITTTTIAIGEVGAGQLLAIARAGGGRFYPAFDAATLPQVFTSEVLTATRLFLREERLAPLVRRHPLLLGLTEAPPALEAYIATSLKPDGEVLLEGHSGEPILAVRRQGLGRSAALTTDLSGWAGAFGRWPDLPGLLGTVVRWLQTSPAQYSVVVTPTSNKLRVAVDAVKDGQFINGLQLEAHYADLAQTLTQVAPGRYEALIEAPPGGGNLLIISGTEVVARTVVSPPNAEFDQTGAALLMQEIARQTGGAMLRRLAACSHRSGGCWPWPGWLCLCSSCYGGASPDGVICDRLKRWSGKAIPRRCRHCLRRPSLSRATR
jgi:hypothetical protein